MTRSLINGELAKAARTIIEQTGDDSKRAGLWETPRRFAEAWEFWTQGWKQNPAECLKTFPAEGANELIFQGGLSMWSTCEHHLAPFFGVCHIGYIPNGKIIGLSKFSRLVDVYARRLQTQERLTGLIAATIEEHLKPKSVGVVLRCRHSCMESRGIQKAGTITYTSTLLGGFKSDISARAEFLQFVALADKECRI